MSAVIRRFMERFFPRENEYAFAIFGTEGGGRTTLLYQLKLGEVITTMPTFGFNVETVDAPTLSGRPLKFTGWDFGLGCASLHTMARLYATYVGNGNALIWVVDASDRGMLEESVQTLEYMMSLVDPILDAADRRNKFPILLLANKRDKPKTMSIDEIRIAFREALSGRTANIFPTSFIQPAAEGGLRDAFGWLQIALELGPGARLDSISETSTSKDLSEKLDSWLTRTETDPSPKEFLEQFNTFNLPAWDHYTHIRIAFVLLTAYGRKEGKDKIFDGIEKYIANSTQVRGRSFHLTLTYFWIQIVHFGMQSVSMSMTSGRRLDPSSLNDSFDPFARFLLLSPYVSDPNLWTEFYSKEVMMSPGARTAFVLPDRKPLPSIIDRDTISTQ